MGITANVAAFLAAATGSHDAVSAARESLNARRAITVLWHNAHRQGIGPDKDYTIEIDELKPDGHKGYEMVEEAVEALMRTVIRVRLANGKTRRVQFLGGNDMDEPDRRAGVLTYSFDKLLIGLLQDSAIWGKIAIPVLMELSSKYAVSLYENVAQLSNLSLKTWQAYSLDEFRDILGVLPGKYKTFGELNKHVLKPAVAEINALAPFNVNVLPVKKGKKVVEVRIGWWPKNDAEQKSAYQELNRSKVGRKARISGTVQHVSSPLPSADRLRRQARLTVQG
jgi:plasmid replication initiation protein